MKKATVRGQMLRLLLPLMLLGAVPSAGANCAVSKLEIPVRIVNERPIGTLQLNGTEVSMLIDTGAFFSILSTATAAQLGLRVRNLPDDVRIHGYTGRMEAKLTRVERVGLRGSELRDVEFIVGGNELGSGIMGVLGRNFLSMADAEYDLAHGVVRLMFPKGDCAKVNLAYWAGTAPVILTPLDNGDFARNTDIRVAPRINGVELHAMMDSGAPRTAITLRAARRAGLKDEDLKDPGAVGGIGKGLVRSWTAQFASFELGGEKIANNEFSVDDVDNDEHDMLIGLDYFLSHRIYVSRLQKRVYATWNGGPVFARGAAAGVYDSRFASRPAEVAADDADGLLRRGQAFAARGDFERALLDLDRACELAPRAQTHFLARARVHLAIKQLEKAQADLDQALRLHPGLGEALAIRAALRVEKGDSAGALADLQALDAALPASDHLRESMAQAFVALGRGEEALRQWALWIPTRRNDFRLGQVLHSRCRLRTRLNIELKLALEDCNAAIRKEPGQSLYHDALGWAYLRLGEAKDAVDAFDDALDRQTYAWSHYGRALAYRRLGQAEKARRDLDAARRLQADIDAEVRKVGLPVADDAHPG